MWAQAPGELAFDFKVMKKDCGTYKGEPVRLVSCRQPSRRPIVSLRVSGRQACRRRKSEHGLHCMLWGCVLWGTHGALGQAPVAETHAEFRSHIPNPIGSVLLPFMPSLGRPNWLEFQVASAGESELRGVAVGGSSIFWTFAVADRCLDTLAPHGPVPSWWNLSGHHPAPRLRCTVARS